VSNATLRLFVWCMITSGLLRDRLEAAERDDRGEVTATTALIVLLVVAAIAAGGIIAAKLVANANNVPSP
jgi:heme A synthase